MTKNRSHIPHTFEEWQRRAVSPTDAHVCTGYNFYKLKQYYDADPNFKGIYQLEGGSRSGKTFDIIRFLYAWAVTQKAEGDFVITREKFTFLKPTVYNDFVRFLKQYKIYNRNKHNKSDHIYQIGPIKFHFIGADQSERFMGMSPVGFWVNEALPNFSKDAFDELDQRTSGFKIVDYNPKLLNFWVYDLQKRPDTCFVHSTILLNPFAPEAAAKRIFAYEPTEINKKQGTANALKWDIYGLGKRGGLAGLVFPDWVAMSDVPPKLGRLVGYGLDYGFANDPTALVEIWMLPKTYTDNKESLFLRTIIYETGLFSGDIDEIARRNNVNVRMPVVADHDSRTNAELAKLGWSISQAQKGTGSIVSGINMMEKFNIFVLADDPINDERSSYSYTPQKADGTKYTNKPADNQADHAIDAARYGITKLLR